MLRTFLCPCPRRNSRPTILSSSLFVRPYPFFLFPSVPRKFLSFSRDREVPCPHKVRVFLGRCIHAFPFSRRTLPLSTPLVHRHLSPPPAPKEIKPHLSSLIIVVTYVATSSGSASARRNEQPGPDAAKTSATGKNHRKGTKHSQRTTRPSFPFR